MHKRIIPVVFIAAASCILVAFLARKYVERPQDTGASTRIVVPRFKSDDKSPDFATGDYQDITPQVSLVPLLNNETLISVLSQDFDGDGFDDQVNAVKTSGSPYLELLVGLYNPAKSVYERMTKIPTEISQGRTFSYTGLDLTGDHRTALVYQGIADNGNSVLQAFFLLRNDGKFTLEKIADLEADGTVFVQQSERSSSYERSLSRGESFPIWAYSSDTSSGGATGQIQTQYSWNEQERKYIQSQQIRVPGSRIAATELARIQDGTVETFASFLDGLWYKTETNGGSQCYLFFDYASREIMFFREEGSVFNWVRSILRRDGIYLSLTNQDVMSFQRRMDIGLRGTDEIRVRINDDIRLLIGEVDVWNGDYKKAKDISVLRKNKDREPVTDSYLRIMQETAAWRTADGADVKFSDGKYTVTGDNIFDTGMYYALEFNGEAFLQFRSSTKSPRFSGTYLLERSDTGLVLQPYRLLPVGGEPLAEYPVLLTVKTEDQP